MDLKGCLIQYCKHLLNVIKQLGPLKHSTEMSHNLDLQFSFLTKYVGLSRVMPVYKQYCSQMHLRWFSLLSLSAETVGFKWKAWHQAKISRDQTKLKLVIAMSCYSIRLQHPESLQGADYDGIHVWRYCPSLPTEYNHMNQGWVAEQSTAEEMKRCLSSCGYCAPDQDRGINTVWTNPRSHTNQTLKSSKHRNIIQQRKDENKRVILLQRIWVRVRSERPRK